MAAREIFGAQEHLDKIEGKGGTRVVGWFTTKQEAEIFSAEIEGVFGTRNDLPVVEGVPMMPQQNTPTLMSPKRSDIVA